MAIGLRVGRGWADALAEKQAAGVETHLGRFFYVSAVSPALSGATVALGPCGCLCFKVQPRVLDALKAPLALVDHLPEDPLSHVQVCVPDPVGVPRVEFVGLWHAAGVGLNLGQELQVGRRVLFFGLPEWYLGSPDVMRRILAAVASTWRARSALETLLVSLVMGILLDALGESACSNQARRESVLSLVLGSFWRQESQGSRRIPAGPCQ